MRAPSGLTVCFASNADVHSGRSTPTTAPSQASQVCVVTRLVAADAFYIAHLSIGAFKRSFSTNVAHPHGTNDLLCALGWYVSTGLSFDVSVRLSVSVFADTTLSRSLMFYMAVCA